MTESATAANRSSQPIDIKSTHVIREWKYTSPFTACHFHPSGRYVFGCCQDQTIQRWDLEKDSHTTLSGHESWLRAIGFSPDGERMFSGGYDGQLLMWNPNEENPAPVFRTMAHDGWVRWLSVSPDGRIVATCGNDRLVKLWDGISGQPIKTFGGHDSHVYCVMFLPDGETLLSGDLSGNVIQWNINDGKQVRSFDASELHAYNGGQRAHYGGVRTMSLSSDGTKLACGGLHKATNPFGAVQEPLIVVFDWKTGEKRTSLEANGIDRGIIWRVIYHPSGVLIGTSGGGSGGFILFWQGDDQKETHKLKLKNTSLDLDLHPNQIDLVTAHHDRHLRISRMQPISQ